MFFSKCLVLCMSVMAILHLSISSPIELTEEHHNEAETDIRPAPPGDPSTLTHSDAPSSYVGSASSNAPSPVGLNAPSGVPSNGVPDQGQNPLPVPGQSESANPEEHQNEQETDMRPAPPGDPSTLTLSGAPSPSLGSASSNAPSPVALNAPSGVPSNGIPDQGNDRLPVPGQSESANPAQGETQSPVSQPKEIEGQPNPPESGQAATGESEGVPDQTDEDKIMAEPQADTQNEPNDPQTGQGESDVSPNSSYGEPDPPAQPLNRPDSDTPHGYPTEQAGGENMDGSQDKTGIDQADLQPDPVNDDKMNDAENRDSPSTNQPTGQQGQNVNPAGDPPSSYQPEQPGSSANIDSPPSQVLPEEADKPDQASQQNPDTQHPDAEQESQQNSENLNTESDAGGDEQSIVDDDKDVDSEDDDDFDYEVKPSNTFGSEQVDRNESMEVRNESLVMPSVTEVSDSRISQNETLPSRVTHPESDRWNMSHSVVVQNDSRVVPSESVLSNATDPGSENLNAPIAETEKNVLGIKQNESLSNNSTSSESVHVTLPNALPRQNDTDAIPSESPHTNAMISGNAVMVQNNDSGMVHNESSLEINKSSFVNGVGLETNDDFNTDMNMTEHSILIQNSTNSEYIKDDSTLSMNNATRKLDSNSKDSVTTSTNESIIPVPMTTSIGGQSSSTPDRSLAGSSTAAITPSSTPTSTFISTKISTSSTPAKIASTPTTKTQLAEATRKVWTNDDREGNKNMAAGNPGTSMDQVQATERIRPEQDGSQRHSNVEDNQEKTHGEDDESEEGQDSEDDLGFDQMSKDRPIESYQRPMNAASGPGTTDADEEESSSHFITYFLLASFLVIVAYLLYHNKQKVMAVIIEGRAARKTGGGQKRPKTKDYVKLSSNIEEVITNPDKDTYKQKEYIY